MTAKPTGLDPEIGAVLRSGEIMRRLLRDIAEEKVLGDTTTLADPSVVEKLKVKYADEAE